MQIIFISSMIQPYTQGQNPLGNETENAYSTEELSQALAREGDTVTIISVLPKDQSPDHRLARWVKKIVFILDGEKRSIPVYEGQIDDSNARALLLSMDSPPQITLDGDLNANPPEVKKQLAWNRLFGKAVLELQKEMRLSANVVHFHGDAVALALLWPQEGETAPSALISSFYNPQKEAVFAAADFENLIDSTTPMASRIDADVLLPTAAQKAVLLSSAVILPGQGCLRQISFSRRRLALKDALLKHPRVYGIMGGVDPKKFNPANGPHFASNFDSKDLGGKAICKDALQKKLGLAPRKDAPLLVAYIGSELEDGTVHLVEAAESILKEDTQVLFVGSASPHLMTKLQRLATDNKSRMALAAYEELSITDVLSGADIVLAANEWAPWGRVAQVGMALGCVPVVHSTGGFSDLVVDWDPETRTGGGFKFRPASSQELLCAVKRAKEVYQSPETWATLARRNMEATIYWPQAVRRFESVYKTVVEED